MMMMKERIFAGHPSLALPPLDLPLLALALHTLALLRSPLPLWPLPHLFGCALALIDAFSFQITLYTGSTSLLLHLYSLSINGKFLMMHLRPLIGAALLVKSMKSFPYLRKKKRIALGDSLRDIRGCGKA